MPGKAGENGTLHGNDGTREGRHYISDAAIWEM